MGRPGRVYSGTTPTGPTIRLGGSHSRPLSRGNHTGGGFQALPASQRAAMGSSASPRRKTAPLRTQRSRRSDMRASAARLEVPSFCRAPVFPTILRSVDLTPGTGTGGRRPPLSSPGLEPPDERAQPPAPPELATGTGASKCWPPTRAWSWPWPHTAMATTPRPAARCTWPRI